MDLRELLDEAVKVRPKSDLTCDAGVGAFARYCARIALESLPCLCSGDRAERKNMGKCDRCQRLASLGDGR